MGGCNVRTARHCVAHDIGGFNSVLRNTACGVCAFACGRGAAPAVHAHRHVGHASGAQQPGQVGGERAVGGIAPLGLMLIALFLIWLGTAWAIFQVTMGPTVPTAPMAFVNDVLFTTQGQTMILVGVGVGFGVGVGGSGGALTLKRYRPVFEHYELNVR